MIQESFAWKSFKRISDVDDFRQVETWQGPRFAFEVLRCPVDVVIHRSELEQTEIRGYYSPFPPVQIQLIAFRILLLLRESGKSFLFNAKPDNHRPHPCKQKNAAQYQPDGAYVTRNYRRIPLTDSSAASASERPHDQQHQRRWFRNINQVHVAQISTSCQRSDHRQVVHDKVLRQTCLCHVA